MPQLRTVYFPTSRVRLCVHARTQHKSPQMTRTWLRYPEKKPLLLETGQIKSDTAVA